MKLSKHETSIQERLRAYQQPVDTEALWAKVSPRTRKRRRVAAWIFVGIGFVIISTVTGVLLKQTNPAQDRKPDTKTTDISSSSFMTFDHRTYNIDNASSSSANDIDQTPSMDPATTTTSGQKLREAVKPTQETVADSITKSTGSVNTDLSRGIQTTATPSSTSQNISNDAYRVFIHRTRTEEENSFDALTSGSLLSNDRMHLGESKVLSEKRGDAMDTGAKNISLRNALTVEFLETTPSFPLYSIQPGTQPTPLPSLRIIRPQIPRIAIGLSGGLGFAHIRYSGNAEQTEYINDVERITEPLPSLHADLILLYRISPKLILQSGLGYTRLTSRTTQSWQETEHIEQPGEVIHIDPEGQVTTTPATVGATQTIMFHAVHHTYLHRMDVPVLLAYRVISLPRSRMYVHGGVLLQLTTRSEGSLLNAESGALYRWTQHDDSPYGNFSSGLVLGVVIEHSLASRMALFASPQLVQHKIGISHNTIVLDQSASVFSCKLGALFQF